MLAQVVAVGLAIVVLAGGLYFVATASGMSTLPCVPGISCGTSHPGGLSFTVQAYNEGQAQYLASSAVAPYLQPGDTVYVGGELGNTWTLADENKWQTEMSSCTPDFTGCQALPSGISYVGQNFILEPAVAHGGFNSNFSGITSDWEPQLGTQFTFNWTSTLAYFAQWASEAHSVGLQAHAYPTGQGLANFTIPYGWNYAEMATLGGSDYVDAETQGAASCANMGTWLYTIQKLDNQFHALGISLSKLTIQISLGDGCWDGGSQNGTNVTFAVSAVKAAEILGNTRFQLWWGGADSSWLGQVLQDLGRT